MILTSMIMLAALQTAQPSARDDALRPIALCVAALEYPKAHLDAEEARRAWRAALNEVSGSDAAPGDAAVANLRARFDEHEATKPGMGLELARAVVTVAPQCLSVDAAALAPAFFVNKAEGSDD